MDIKTLGKHLSGCKIVPKLVLLLIFVVVTNPGIAARIQMIGIQIGLIVYVATWLASIFAIVVVAFSANWAARIFWSVLWVASAAAALSFQYVTGNYISVTDVEVLMNAAAFASDAADAFGRQIMLAITASIVGLLAINIPPYMTFVRECRSRCAAMAVVPLVPVIMIASIVYVRGGNGTNGLPGQFSVPAFLVVLGVADAKAGPSPMRNTVTATPDASEVPQTIVVIMDESVRGDALDINGGPAYSGLEDRNAVVVNFGVASSLANCSAASNVSFRYGASRAHYLSDIQVNPSMWEYARRAGFHTYYIDAQRNGGKLQNLMTEHERSFVDRFEQIGADVAPEQKDMKVAAMLRTILGSSEPGKKFIYVNKMGVHFPYEGKYPHGEARFNPTMARTYFGNQADPKVKWSVEPTPEGRRAIHNSYLNGVSWNVGHFFDVLLAGLHLDNTVVVYTSDHGQEFHEDGSPGLRTHCTDGPAAAGEGRIPLVLMTGDQDWLQRFRQDARLNYGAASQFNVFPTILVLMGYKLDEVGQATHVELPLSAKLDPEKQQFLSTYFVRFGRNPVWNPIH